MITIYSLNEEIVRVNTVDSERMYGAPELYDNVLTLEKNNNELLYNDILSLPTDYSVINNEIYRKGVKVNINLTNTKLQLLTQKLIDKKLDNIELQELLYLTFKDTFDAQL